MAEKKMRFLHWKNLDHFLITIVYILAVCGLVCIYSATRTSDSGTRQMIVQSAALVLGTVMMLLISRIDYDIYPAFVKLIYAASVAILAFVLVFGQGKEETGANSWISLGAISIQPSEFVKITFAITFSVHLDSVKGNINRFSVLIKLFLHFAVIAGLVLLQNDTGTTLVFAFMFFVMLFIGGLSFKYIIAAFAGAAVLVPVAWFGLMQPYQKERILVFLNPERDASGYGYQVSQSKIAIGSGEFAGRGYLLGPQNQLGLLPERDTDFIFGALGEEFGFLGAMLIVILLTLLIIRCFHASVKAKDDRGRFLCGGIAAMFMFHVIENIFMCIGLLPVTGIPLPFLSYGGSSLVANFIAIGLVLGVWSRRRIVKFEVTY
ncbi:MAG: rod shape-determining protein RodA [Ruminococcaceae bacterium]|nr:rod shape-determining protein RodA [Oscillospiraceae bacterium]